MPPREHRRWCFSLYSVAAALLEQRSCLPVSPPSAIHLTDPPLPFPLQAASIATLTTLIKEGLPQQAGEKGEYMLARLRALQDR